MSAPPFVLAGFTVESFVARGGMGEIWRARSASGEAVAIKRLLVDGRDPQGQLRPRLQREIQALARLRHDSIVRCLDSGLDDQGQPYLVLEWLDGENLAERQARTPLTLAQALPLIGQVLEGLAACHDAGIVHRDIKPGNLVLAEETCGKTRLKIVDFGLAFLGTEATRVTSAGDIVGTLYYMAPEQARGVQEVDPRTDIYAVGVILYELSTGRLPFAGDQAMAVLLKIVTETPPRPRQIRPEVPEWLEAVILRAMARAPSERFSSALEMASALAGGPALPMVILAPPAALAATLATTSLESRLVSLLCIQPLEPGLELPTDRTVTEQGGVVHRFLGGATISVFGLDRTMGDEALRTIRAGLAIRQVAGRRARLLAATVRVEVGLGVQLDAKDLDETLAKLRGLPPGHLIVDAATQQLARGQVEVARVGTHEAAIALVEGAPARRRVLGVETPTIGRESELAAIRAAFYRALDNGEPEAVLVVGPPGIGKSRLREELLPELRTRAALWLEARAESPKTKTAFGLLGEAVARCAGIHLGHDLEARHAALRRLFRSISDQSVRERAAAFLGEVLGAPFPESPALRVARADPKVMREQVTSAFFALCESARREGPVVLCLEDLHWADRESLALCEELVARLDSSPFFILGTARAEVDDHYPRLFAAVELTRLDLKPLSPRQLRRLLRTMLGGEVSRELEELVVGWSEGNPYFAEELVSFLVARGAIVLDHAGWRSGTDPAALELPVGIEGVIQGRLDRLPLELKELVKAAAVYGEVFWDTGCVALGFTGIAAQLQNLEAAEVVLAASSSRVAGAREWTFRHALLQQVAYRLLPLDRRRALHLGAACWLEEVGEPDPVLLAHHFQCGGDEKRAADYLARAATRALADGNFERAVECFRSSIVPGASHVESALRRLGLTRSLILAGRYGEAEQSLDQLANSEASDDLQRAQALLLSGRIWYARGASAEGEHALREAARLAALLGERELAFEVQHALFYVIWVQGRYREAGPISDNLLRSALADGQPEHLCLAKLASAYIHAADGDPARALDAAAEALGHAREIGHGFREIDALILVGSMEELLGRYEQALSAFTAAKQIRLCTAHQQANLETCLARVALLRGDPVQALELYEAAISKAETLDDTRTLAIVFAGAARARMAQREPDLAEAARLGERALGLSEGKTPAVVAEARLALALIALAARQPLAAVEHALAAVALVDHLGSQSQYEIEILLAAHDALRAAERNDEAEQFLARARRVLATRAERISDGAVRDSFLTNVPSHARLRALVG